MGKVTESIFSGKATVIPMADVQFIERDERHGYEDAFFVVLSGTTWNSDIDAWNNAAYLRHEEAESFIRCWCTYRAELEAETIADISPNEIFPGTLDGLNGLGIRPKD